jgi:hypothetical protein
MPPKDADHTERFLKMAEDVAYLRGRWDSLEHTLNAHTSKIEDLQSFRWRMVGIMVAVGLAASFVGPAVARIVAP